MSTRRLTIGFLLVGLFLPAWACMVAPKTQSERNRDLVESTPVIVLAKVVSHADQEGGPASVFGFEVLSSLKGKQPASFSLTGFHADRVNGPGDFEGHRRPEFWAFDAGNAIPRPDCVAYGLFEKGRTYLIFLRRASHIRAYEEIRTQEDLWLKVVQVLVREQGQAGVSEAAASRGISPASSASAARTSP